MSTTVSPSRGSARPKPRTTGWAASAAASAAEDVSRQSAVDFAFGLVTGVGAGLGSTAGGAAGMGMLLGTGILLYAVAAAAVAGAGVSTSRPGNRGGDGALRALAGGTPPVPLKADQSDGAGSTYGVRIRRASAMARGSIGLLCHSASAAGYL